MTIRNINANHDPQSSMVNVTMDFDPDDLRWLLPMLARAGVKEVEIEAVDDGD